MNCREFVDFLMDYLDDHLSEAQDATFRMHMLECPSCERYLDTYREAVRLGKTCCEDLDGPVPEDLPEALVNTILAARREN
jgi:predicted anti-sigma-YlaC factor YlaD